MLGLFVSPLTQLMIAYPEVLIQSDGLAIAQATRTFKDFRSNPLAPMSLDIQRELRQGMAGSLELPAVTLKPLCAGTICGFPKFQSLGICTKISNITHLLNVTAGPTIPGSSPASKNRTTSLAALPPNANCKLNTTFPYGVATCKTNGTESLSLPNDSNLKKATIYSMPIIYSNGGNVSHEVGNEAAKTPWEFQAVEVVFHLCINNYEMKVYEGDVVTTVTESPVVVASGSGERTLDINCGGLTQGVAPSGCSSSGSKLGDSYLQLLNPVTQDPAKPPEYFMAELRTLETVALSLNSVTMGLWEWNGLSYEGTEQAAVGAKEVQAIASAIYGPNDDDPAKQFERVSKVMQNIATAMTNV